MAARRPQPQEHPDLRPLNKLLAGLPVEDFERLRPHLKTVPIAARQSLYHRNEPVREVYFPNGGVVSITSVMQDGSTVEIATVGDEGLLGIDAFFGPATITGEVMMQVPDTDAEVMTADAFTQELERRGPFHASVQRYFQGFIALIMQSTACIALHPVQQRCCRWLLMTHDRIHRDQFDLSHEFLAMMLGSSRPTVTIVAGMLQRAGLIRYTHGRMTILDRTALEGASCECYETVRRHFDRLGL
jgi:CRP-like cAMP-binding protein